jgi:TatD DNase family protein
MIDSHCHLDSKVYKGTVPDLLMEARSAGVHTIVNIGADMPSSEASVKLAGEHDMLYATVGVHPHDATTLDDRALARLRQLATQPKVVAIGEIGLDYYRDLSPRPVQKDAFRRQLALAVSLKMPIVIHTRDSFEDTIEIVRDYASSLPGGVFHCFPGSTDDAMRVIELGFVISVGGVITYNKAGMAVVATEVPLDKVIIETDAPYLTPVPHRGTTNRPALVTLVAQKMAQLRGIPVSEVERRTDQNARKLYRLVETFGG